MGAPPNIKMKTVLIFAILFCGVYSASSLARKQEISITKMEKVAKPMADGYCSICVSFMGQAIDNLLNIILQGGVLGGCGALCGKLPNQLEATICDLLCDYVGIVEFQKVINQTDPDPIYYCESLKFCRALDTAKADINSLAVHPQSGQQGTEFEFLITYTVQSEIGTGQLVIAVVPQDAEPIEGGNLIVDQEPGTYQAGFKIQAKPSQQEPWNPGQYFTEVAVCEGTCGSRHPDSFLLGLRNTSFTITQ